MCAVSPTFAEVLEGRSRTFAWSTPWTTETVGGNRGFQCRSHAIWILDALFIPNIEGLFCFTMYIHVSKTYTEGLILTYQLAVQRYPTILSFINVCSPSIRCLLAPPDFQTSLHKVEQCHSVRFLTDPRGWKDRWWPGEGPQGPFWRSYTFKMTHGPYYLSILVGQC